MQLPFFVEDFLVRKVENRVFIAALIVVSDVENGRICWMKLSKSLPAASLERRLLYQFRNKLQITGESETGLVSNEFPVKFLDPVCQDTQTVNIGNDGVGDRSIVSKDSSRCGTQVLFEWLIVWPARTPPDQLITLWQPHRIRRAVCGGPSHNRTRLH